MVWLAGYCAWGRASIDADTPTREPPFPIIVDKATSHCGAGCTLGDLIAEWHVFVFPTIAVWFGWHTLFAERTFAIPVSDFLVAPEIGVIFPFFSIAPMRHLSLGEG
ncbi:DUF4396 domain-containing protein [Sphingomonas sp. UYP23]